MHYRFKKGIWNERSSFLFSMVCYLLFFMSMDKRILIVDDDVPFLKGLSKALNKCCGFQGEVSVAENGEKALADIRYCPYDLCFLDVNLPDMNGLDIMKTILEISPRTKIAIMTASFITDDMQSTIEGGASILIKKPVDLDEVKYFINSLIKDPGYVTSQDQQERRTSARKPFTRTLHYCLSLLDNGELQSGLKSHTIDISSEGMGIVTEQPLKTGQLIRFDTESGHRNGLVRWSMKAGDDFRAGIKFT